MYDEGEVVAFALEVDALLAPDSGRVGVVCARMQFDAMTMGYAAARAKHGRELRAELGVSVPDAPGPRPVPLPRGSLPALDGDDEPHPPEYPTALRCHHEIPYAVPADSPRWMRGNFCGMRIPGLPPVKGGAADPSLVFTPFIDRYHAADQDAIVAGILARGYRDVKLSWPDSRDGHNQSMSDYVGTARRLHDAGLRTTHMLLSKDFDGRNPNPQLLGPILDALIWTPGAADKVCCFWEGNLFIDPQPTIQRIIDFVCARTVPAGILTYVHFSPGVIAWQKDGQTTADFWKPQVGKLTGLLHQVDPAQTAAQMQARLNDGLVRFGGGLNFPADSGFGHPFDLVSDEVGASRMFNGASENDGDKYGYLALCAPGPVPVMGFGNGARYPDGGVI